MTMKMHSVFNNLFDVDLSKFLGYKDAPVVSQNGSLCLDQDFFPDKNTRFDSIKAKEFYSRWLKVLRTLTEKTFELMPSDISEAFSPSRLYFQDLESLGRCSFKLYRRIACQCGDHADSARALASLLDDRGKTTLHTFYDDDGQHLCTVISSLSASVSCFEAQCTDKDMKMSTVFGVLSDMASRSAGGDAALDMLQAWHVVRGGHQSPSEASRCDLSIMPSPWNSMQGPTMTDEVPEEAFIVHVVLTAMYRVGLYKCAAVRRARAASVIRHRPGCSLVEARRSVLAGFDHDVLTVTSSRSKLHLTRKRSIYDYSLLMAIDAVLESSKRISLARTSFREAFVAITKQNRVVAIQVKVASQSIVRQMLIESIPKTVWRGTREKRRGDFVALDDNVAKRRRSTSSSTVIEPKLVMWFSSLWTCGSLGAPPSIQPQRPTAPDGSSTVAALVAACKARSGAPNAKDQEALKSLWAAQAALLAVKTKEQLESHKRPEPLMPQPSARLTMALALVFEGTLQTGLERMVCVPGAPPMQGFFKTDVYVEMKNASSNRHNFWFEVVLPTLCELRQFFVSSDAAAVVHAAEAAAAAEATVDWAAWGVSIATKTAILARVLVGSFATSLLCTTAAGRTLAEEVILPWLCQFERRSFHLDKEHECVQSFLRVEEQLDRLTRASRFQLDNESVLRDADEWVVSLKHVELGAFQKNTTRREAADRAASCFLSAGDGEGFGVSNCALLLNSLARLFRLVKNVDSDRFTREQQSLPKDERALRLIFAENSRTWSDVEEWRNLEREKELLIKAWASDGGRFFSGAFLWRSCGNCCSADASRYRRLVHLSTRLVVTAGDLGWIDAGDARRHASSVRRSGVQLAANEVVPSPSDAVVVDDVAAFEALMRAAGHAVSCIEKALCWLVRLKQGCENIFLEYSRNVKKTGEAVEVESFEAFVNQNNRLLSAPQ